jgi:hypothetical protein
MALQQTLVTKLQEAEQLSAQIRQLVTDSEEQKEAIFRWAALGDEVKK